MFKHFNADFASVLIQLINFLTAHQHYIWKHYPKATLVRVVTLQNTLGWLIAHLPGSNTILPPPGVN